MKMRFEFAGSMAAVAAAMLLLPVSACVAETAGEVFAAHREEIATNRCVAVGGYVFGVGRAISKNGGDAVGFAKARLLAQAKILDYAGIPMIEIAGVETVFEKREAPEHYLAVVAAPEAALPRCGLRGLKNLADRTMDARPQKNLADRTMGTRDLNPADRTEDAIEEYESRGYWEEAGIKANETMSEGQFL